ncbi:hypothetical protein ACPCG0_09530 [Propionibacteriaceae bacterium Y1923]|uniref:hypothetical protein n=1 Tax=Aestuariimicrobium sp. Y1814 TaxID=3418742 RepID=UPI003C27BEFC
MAKRGYDDPTPDEDAPADQDGSGWQHVSSPASSDSADKVEPSDGLVRERRRRRGPSRAAEPVPSRTRLLVIAGIVSLLLVATAAGVGWIYARSQPAAVTTQTQVATRPPFELVLPLEIGEYSRDANQGNSPNVGSDGKTTISATYARGGQPAFVLLLGRPYDDNREFMRDLNMNAVSEVEDGLCGISGDNQNNGCALIRDNTGILVLSTVDMSRADLMALTKQAATQLTGE